MKITSRHVRLAAYAITLLVLHGKAAVHEFDQEGIALEKIARMPAERCQADLVRLQGFHYRTREMSSRERNDYFAELLRLEGATGTPPPPPAAPCSRIELALAACAGERVACEPQLASR